MKKPFKLIGIIVTILIIGGLTFRILTHGSGETVESITDIQKREGVPVRVETVPKGSLIQTLHFSGTIEGEEQAAVLSRLLETVSEIPVSVGTQVKSGQVVARLDENNPQAGYHQARFTVENARIDLRRITALYEKGAVSHQTLDQAQLSFDLAQATFEAARDLVELRSPIDGIVQRIHYKPGEVAQAGTPVVTVASSEKLRVRLYVTASERSQLAVGQPARIYHSLTDTAWTKAEVSRIDEAADPNTRLFEVWVLTLKPENTLKPGTLTDVEIEVNRLNDVLTIDTEAFETEESGKRYVFIVDDTDHAERRDLITGMEASGRIAVTSGLSEGERVIVYGHNRISVGDPVRIISQ